MNLELSKEEKDKGYIAKVGIKTRFADGDPQGIVNNSVYLVYYDEARVEFIENYLEMYDDKIAMMIVSETNNRYILPLKASQKIVVYLKLLKQTPVRSVFKIEIYNSDNELVNECKQTMAWVSRDLKIVNLKKQMPEMYDVLKGMEYNGKD